MRSRLMTQGNSYDFSRKFHITWHAVTAGVATALVSAAVLFVLLLSILRQEMTDNAPPVLLREWRAVFDETSTVLDRLNTLDLPRCGTEILKIMRFEEFPLRPSQGHRRPDAGAYDLHHRARPPAPAVRRRHARSRHRRRHPDLHPDPRC